MRRRLPWPRGLFRRRVLATLAGLASLAAIAAIVVAATRPSPELPPCETATFTPPDFQSPPFAFDPEARAQAFVEAMASNDFQTAYGMVALEEIGGASLCELNLEHFWRAVANGHTTLLSVERFSPLVYAAVYDYLSIRLRLTLSADGANQPEREAYIEVLLTPDGRIASFGYFSVLTELGTPPESPPPPYAAPESFAESEVTVGTAPWELGGTLAMPSGVGPFPAVVILGRGGGRDGVEGANKRDRDFAQGLAAHGVAALRYDSRSWAYGLEAARQPEFTMADETVDDALAAVALLRQMPRIDPERIYVLGIGFASFASVRAAHLDSELAGLILISPSAGLIWDWAWRAHQERADVDEVVTEQEAREVEVLKARAATIAAVAAGTAPPPDLGVRIDYHLNLVTYRPERASRTLKTPILALFGDRDGVVPIEDPEAWISNLLGRADAAIRVYEGHSHGMFDVLKLSGPESRLEGHVDEEVMVDIVAWVEGDWPRQTCQDLEAWFAGCRGG